MNGDHPTVGDIAYEQARSNADAIKRLAQEVQRIRVSLDDLLTALDTDGVITLIGPNDSIDEAEEVEYQRLVAAEEEYMELHDVWESHQGRHNCYYEQSEESYSDCPVRGFNSFESFYENERNL